MYEYRFEAGDRVVKVEPKEDGSVDLVILDPRHGRGRVTNLDGDKAEMLSEILILAKKQASDAKTS